MLSSQNFPGEAGTGTITGQTTRSLNYGTGWHAGNLPVEAWERAFGKPARSEIVNDLKNPPTTLDSDVLARHVLKGSFDTDASQMDETLRAVSQIDKALLAEGASPKEGNGKHHAMGFRKRHEGRAMVGVGSFQNFFLEIENQSCPKKLC